MNTEDLLTTQSHSTPTHRWTPSFPAVIDSTILSTFTDCPLKAFREFCLRLGSPYESVHLHAGGAFARALEVVRTEVWENGKSYQTGLEEAFKEFSIYWGDFEVPEQGSGSTKTYERMWGAVEDYFREYPIDSDPIRPYQFDDGRSGIEFRWSVPLNIPHPDTGDPIIFGGRTDLLGYYDNVLAIIDEKTTTQLGQSWVDQWKMRGQFMGYIWAANQTGLDCKTAIVRGISILKTKYGHLQCMVLHSPHMIERWERNMLHKIKYFIQLYQLYKKNMDKVTPEDIFPMDFSNSCNSYAGCMYKDLCLAKNPADWYDNYRVREWHPLEKDPNKAKGEEL